MAMADLVAQLRQNDDCQVLPASGIPSAGLRLPADVEEFYRLCGGATLFQGADYSIDIVAPSDFVRANPVIVGKDGADDISYDWFVIAKAGEQYITIDLNESRIGRCYDSFWDRHGVAGECKIVATSFEGLLEQLIETRGAYWYWLDEDFQSLGDAYNE
jgi:antitoxin YokJ